MNLSPVLNCLYVPYEFFFVKDGWIILFDIFCETNCKAKFCIFRTNCKRMKRQALTSEPLSSQCNILSAIFDAVMVIFFSGSRELAITQWR